MTNEQLIYKAIDLTYQLKELLNEISTSEDSLVDKLSLDSLFNADEITNNINNDLIKLQNKIKGTNNEDYE